MIKQNALELIGNTPIVRLVKLTSEDMADIYIKLESFNPAGSIKDRAAYQMIVDAEERGDLVEGSVIVEPTSGNTGIALAMIGKIKGYDVKIVMPDSMSAERRNLIRSYGAELVLTDGKLGMKGAIEEADRLVAENEHYYQPGQFVNQSNVKAHYYGTGPELLKQIGKIDAFVAGIGTGGTISGTGKRLKEELKEVLIVGVEPKESNILSGGEIGAHSIQGIGAGFAPAILNREVIDEIMEVASEDAKVMTKTLLNSEGLFVGISSAANVVAAIEIAKRLGKGKKVVTVAPDSGSKYISMGLYY
ncbi:MAG: cysteine synthase A [Clostridia bacterium]|nr:cysteine synthase A [Clostridia bacterium]